MKNAVNDARKLIQARMAELHQELGYLKRALEQLDGADGSSKPAKARGRGRGRGRAKAAGRRKRSSKRAARGQRREQLLAAIKTNPGAGASDLAKEIGVKPGQVYGLLRKAQADKLIAKDGKGYKLKG